jgi:enoyl-CoA hydratase/3-hydroxyacyl-CoA dehydrogenase
MAYSFQGRSFQKIGVIGSGQIGPDIALYFSKVLSRQGVEIVVVDISDEALAKGEKKFSKKIAKGEETGAFDADWASAMRGAVTWTSDYGQLADADFIVEAATEDQGLKGRIFGDLEKRCRPDTIFASNSSHLEPERIFEGIKDKSRTLVIHYFFPAERNPMVELVPGAETSSELTALLKGFYEVIGKVPIVVGSRYGYALDPVFEGVFQAAALLAESGVATPKEIDAVATKALGLGVGPFTAMNLTGGNPITAVGLDNYTSRIHEWYRTPQILKDAVASGTPWEVPGRGEKVEVSDDKRAAITDALRGAFFGICTEIVDSGISNVDDMDMSVELGLVMKAPFRFMNELGTAEALRLVQAYAASNPGFPVPALLKQHGQENQPFEVKHITREDKDGVAVLTIRRPAVLNALNQAVFDELRGTFAALDADDSVQAIVLTGFGVKAFVSGADVHFLAKIESVEQGAATSADSQGAIQAVEDCKKPIVCAYNGLAFGGGNELAMACNVRIARSDLKVLAAQPEPSLGIIPGAGGTQRLPRLVGFEAANEMLRTGRPISAQKAHEIGLVHELVEGDVVALRERAIEIARELASGKRETPVIEQGPLSEVPAELPEVKIGHFSTAVDKLIVEAMLEGAKMSLKDGLAFEAQKFGEVCGLEDMRIGVDNFIKNGPRNKAEFVHR